MAVVATSAKWLLILVLLLTVMTSHGERASRRRPVGQSSCHVTQTGTGCRYALSLLPLNGGASCGQRRHGNVTSSTTPADIDVITDKLDDAVVKVTRMIKQLSVRCLRHLRQIKADLRKVQRAWHSTIHLTVVVLSVLSHKFTGARRQFDIGQLPLVPFRSYVPWFLGLPLDMKRRL